MTFDEFDLNDQVLEAISYMGFDKASPIQEKAIPIIMKGNDLIACAQTGTGKTAAYVLPLLHKISESKKHGLKALIIVPVRELAKQIEQQIQGFAYFLPINSQTIYGGGDGSTWELEHKALIGNADVIVATPGRIISHLNQIDTQSISLEYLVLDEADKMLDMGFFEDIQKIVSYLPKERQTLMFSATMPSKIRELAKQILHRPSEINIELSKPAEGISQSVYLTFEPQKIPLIIKLISEKPEFKSILIFTSAKSKINDIVKSLTRKNLSAEGISSDLEQDKREEVLLRFRARQTTILVATDVMSRGLDIKEIELVINFDVPHDAENYVHRVGRTARAETSGQAITLVNEFDMKRLKDIEKLIDTNIERIELPAEFGNGPAWNPRAILPIKNRRPFLNKGNSPRRK